MALIITLLKGSLVSRAIDSSSSLRSAGIRNAVRTVLGRLLFSLINSFLNLLILNQYSSRFTICITACNAQCYTDFSGGSL
jgi:hypothetical protein